MAKKFLEGVDLKAQHGRNGFDVSYQNQFTVPFGMMLPFFFQRVNPNDKIKLSCESQTVCDGLARPAFMRLREHLDYYFIPATQLWMPFDNFVTGQNSFFSKSVSDVNESAVPTSVPTFTLNWLNKALEYWQEHDTKDDLGYPFAQGTVRLLDLLGYCNLTAIANDDFVDLQNLGWDGNTSQYNLFPLLCYQKVYYDYFRNIKYEDNLVGAYNVDDLASASIISQLADVDFNRMSEIFKIHYRWQKRDYFTQTQPNVLVQSSQIGYDNLPSQISLGSLFQVPGVTRTLPAVINSNYGANSGAFVRTGGTSGVNSSGSPTVTDITTTGVSVANIRFAFAYDKLLRRMREAGADFDKQMLAQFGVTPFDARHGKCIYLGGYTNRLSSKDVTNVTGDSIGELAGQINSYNDNTGRTLHYHAKEHGYIIGIYSTSVDNMYQSYRSSRETMLMNRFDWFNPAFENLGLQPLFAIERDYTDTGTYAQQPPKGSQFDVNSRTNIIGYVPRYSELKTRVDECHGNLCNYSEQTGLREWNVQSNTQFENQQTLNKSNMLLSPSQFDPVADIDYSGRQTDDHFIVNMFNHSKKVSNMSLYEDF